MGLDMYLYTKRYTSEYSEKEFNSKLRELFPEVPVTNNLNSIEVSLEIGYWRKANHIHKWFVDNVQEGEDDCNDYYVSRENLHRLKKACVETLAYLDTLEKVTSDKHPEYYYFKAVCQDGVKLPTQPGFFFGSTDYDKWYYQDCLDTIEIIDKCLTLPDRYNFSYHSSW